MRQEARTRVERKAPTDFVPDVGRHTIVSQKLRVVLVFATSVAVEISTRKQESSKSALIQVLNISPTGAVLAFQER